MKNININKKFIDENQAMLKAMEYLIRIDKNKKCFMCRHKFVDGILNKQPNKVVPFMKLVRADFLFHLKESHGIEPMEFLGMLEKMKTK